MSIYVQNTNITGVNLNQSALSIVNYNGFQVFPETIYQFPCDTAYFPVKTTDTYNFFQKFDGQVSGQLARYVFTDSLEDRYCYYSSSTGYSTTTEGKGSIALLFPFPIQVQSVTIANTTKASNTTYGSLVDGYIYIMDLLPDGSTENNYKNQVDDMMNSTAYITYAEVKRDCARANDSGYETTHSNPELANNWTRWVVFRSKDWLSTLTEDDDEYAYAKSGLRHVIGGIYIKFKANPLDIKAWNEAGYVDNVTDSSNPKTLKFIPITD